MQIVLISNNSGSNLWPISHVARPKQFSRLLDVNGKKEAMAQRIIRQLHTAGIDGCITIAADISQKDSAIALFGDTVNIATIQYDKSILSTIYDIVKHLEGSQGCNSDEIVVVMPCGIYAENGYFESIKRMVMSIENSIANVAVMGTSLTAPSSEYGYVITDQALTDGIRSVKGFINNIEKPAMDSLKYKSIYANGGVYAFRLGVMLDVVNNTQEQNIGCADEIIGTSFNLDLGRHSCDMVMVEYDGKWNGLDTWDEFASVLQNNKYGNVITDGTEENTVLINELTIPLVCIGTKDLIVAASPDGIVVTDRCKSVQICKYADSNKMRPMFEERRWGTYKVIDMVKFTDGYGTLTKQLTLNPGCAISYQRHFFRDEVWTFIDGEGEIVLNDIRKTVSRGDTVVIPQGTLHSLRATTTLTFIEVQSGTNLVEEDIERFDYSW